MPIIYPGLTPYANSPPGLLHRPMRSVLGSSYAGAYYVFTGGSVYTNGTLTTAFSGNPTADSYGRFPAIYLDPSITYTVSLYNSSGTLIYGPVTVNPPLSGQGGSTNLSGGISQNSYGEITITEFGTGGNGVALSLVALPGRAALKISSPIPGNPALILNSTVTTGSQTATFTATNKPGVASSAPTAWLPLQCDGSTYFMPLWRADGSSGGVPTVGGPQGETISGASVLFTGYGATTVTSGSASPPNWYTPQVNNIGGSYWINITKTSGNAGQSFGNAQGAWTNITNSGLTVPSGSPGNASFSGTYQLSTSSSGSPVVANGTITITGANGPVTQTLSPSYMVFNTNGTITSISGPANWFSPTTTSIGSSYYIQFSVTTGTLGGATSGAWNALSSALNVYPSTVTGNSQLGNVVSGTYQVSTSAGSSGLVASGSFSFGSPSGSGYPIAPDLGLTAMSNSYAMEFATTGEVLGTNGNILHPPFGVWYAGYGSSISVGASYWIKFTGSGGTPQYYNGSSWATLAMNTWYNVSANGFSIQNASTTTAWTGTYTISSASGGSPICASGPIALYQS